MTFHAPLHLRPRPLALAAYTKQSGKVYFSTMFQGTTGPNYIGDCPQGLSHSQLSTYFREQMSHRATPPLRFFGRLPLVERRPFPELDPLIVSAGLVTVGFVFFQDWRAAVCMIVLIGLLVLLPYLEAAIKRIIFGRASLELRGKHQNELRILLRLAGRDKLLDATLTLTARGQLVHGGGAAGAASFGRERITQTVHLIDQLLLDADGGDPSVIFPLPPVNSHEVEASTWRLTYTYRPRFWFAQRKTWALSPQQPV